MTDSPSVPQAPSANAQHGARLVVHVVVALVVAGVVVGVAGVVGHHNGERAAADADVVRAKTQMLTRLAKEAADAEADATALQPKIVALRQREERLEAENAAALARLRAHAETRCSADGADVLRFEAPRAAAHGVVLGEALREAFPCGVPEEDLEMGYTEKPSVTLDVVDFGVAVAGPCAGARLVRISLRCSFEEFDQDCAGEADECARFRAPEPSYRWHDRFGCIRTGPTGRESLADAGDCGGDDDSDDDDGAQVNDAHLYWLMTAQQAIYVRQPSVGWPELSDAEVAPGQLAAAELDVVVRAAGDVALPTWTLPDEVTVGRGVLMAKGRESLDGDAINGPRRRELDGGLVAAPSGGGHWNVQLPDGRSRRYRESIEVSQSFSDADIDPAFAGDDVVAPVVIGDEHVCQRTDQPPPAPGGPFKRVATSGGGGIFVDGDVVRGKPLEEVVWETPFGEGWRCFFRGAAPYPTDIDDPPWTLDISDEDRTQYRWCFP